MEKIKPIMRVRFLLETVYKMFFEWLKFIIWQYDGTATTRYHSKALHVANNIIQHGKTDHATFSRILNFDCDLFQKKIDNFFLQRCVLRHWVTLNTLLGRYISCQRQYHKYLYTSGNFKMSSIYKKKKK